MTYQTGKTPFSYMTNKPVVPIRDPRINKALKDIKGKFNAVEVSGLRREDTKEKYMGATDREMKQIIINKTLTPRQKYETALHEIGHYKFEQVRPKFTNKDIQELKKSKMYKAIKKDGYSNEKIPEEIAVEYYSRFKSRGNHHLIKFRERCPSAGNKIHKFTTTQYY